MATSPRSKSLAEVFSNPLKIPGLVPVMSNSDEYLAWLLADARVTDRHAIHVPRKAAYNTVSPTDCTDSLTSASPSADNQVFNLFSYKAQFDVCNDVAAQYSNITEQFAVELSSAMEDVANSIGDDLIDGAGSTEIYGLENLLAGGNSFSRAGSSLAYADLNKAVRLVKAKGPRMAWVVGGAAHDAMMSLLTTGPGGTTTVDVFGNLLNVPSYRNAPILLSDHVGTNDIFYGNFSQEARGIGLYFGVSALDEENLDFMITEKVGPRESVDQTRYRLKVRVAQVQQHALSLSRCINA